MVLMSLSRGALVSVRGSSLSSVAGHQRQGGILGAGDGNLPVQFAAAPHDDRIHVPTSPCCCPPRGASSPSGASVRARAWALRRARLGLQRRLQAVLATPYPVRICCSWQGHIKLGKNRSREGLHGRVFGV